MHEARHWIGRGFCMLAMFLAITFGFVAYRHSSCPIWNDSACVFHPQGDDEPVRYWDKLRKQYELDPLSTLAPCINQCFLGVQSGGYRPVSGLWTGLAAIAFYSPSSVPLPLLFATGSILGCLAVTLFHVARRFVQHDLTAFGAVFLVLASPPLVGSSWVCVAGIQALVPLLFCMSLLCYWNLIEGRNRTVCAVTLVLLLVLGPWVREFFGLNSILLLLLELRRGRFSWITIAAALGFLHALFPTALIHFLFLPTLEVKPVYLLGTLSTQMENGGLRWQAPWHFLPLFPPTLILFAGIEALFRLRSGQAIGSEPFPYRLGWIVTVIQRLSIPCWLLATISLFLLEPRYHGCFGLALCLMVAALGIRRDFFLGCWFILMFVPILRVFSEHVHFLYAIPPAAIILAESVESLWFRIQSTSALSWLRYGMACLLAVIGLDQGMNLYAAYKINHSTYRGIDEVADWFVSHSPKDAAVVTNVIHGDEIKWHGNCHIEIYWTITTGIDDPQRAVDRPEQLEKLLAKRNARPVYFLDVDFDYLPEKRDYHRHKYVHLMDVEKRGLGEIHVTKCSYPFVDPLRYLIPRKYLPFLGAPDLENDFSSMRSKAHPFCNEVSATYRVYEVSGGQVKANLNGTVRLAQENVYGFNIVQVGLGYHALPQGEGAFDAEKFLRHGYSAQFSGESLQSVRDQIEAARQR